MNAYQRVDQWIMDHKDEIIEFLQNLLQIPSVTGNEGPIQQFIADYTKRIGASVEVFVPDYKELKKHPAFVATKQSYEGRPNVVATYTGTGAGHSLLFNGHVDVVPEGDPDNWEHGCWSGDLKDGKIYGRGASDMKSGVAAITLAMKALYESGVKLKGDVISEYVMDEELTGNGTLACCIRGYHADAGICCETSSMCVQPGSIGRIWFTINVKGKAAGIQKHFEGVSGIDLGYIVVQAVAAFEKKRWETVTSPLYPDIQSSIPCTIGKFSSGSFNSAFPDACELLGSMATVPGENSDKVKRQFLDFILSYCAEHHDWFKHNPPKVTYTGYFAEPSELPLDAPIVNSICSEYENALGKKPIVSGRSGAADTRHLNTYAHTPTVIFGPGLTEQMHANNEWVYADDYIQSIRVLARTVISWCEAEE